MTVKVVMRDLDIAIGSVVFGLDGVEGYHTEIIEPYLLNGNDDTVYAVPELTDGEHTISAQAFIGPDGAGGSEDTATISTVTSLLTAFNSDNNHSNATRLAEGTQARSGCGFQDRATKQTDYI
jgi:hypothetical protein